MSPPKLPGRPRWCALLLCGALLACAAALAGVASAASVSANWAGYVALPRTAGEPFKSVSGTWTEPSVTCTAAREAYSAVWVGLGGYREDSKALEQIGTEADCSRNGQPRYTTWYELIPAAPVTLSVKVAPGDEMVASVTVGGRDVTLRLRDLTSGARYSLTRPATTLDASSAEWILEAPSTCLTEGSCETLPLSDFDSVSFASATATLGTRTAGVASPYWSDVALELRQGSGGDGFGSWRHARAESGAALIAATPSGLAGEGAFSVHWQEQPLQSEGPPVPHFFKTRAGP